MTVRLSAQPVTVDLKLACLPVQVLVLSTTILRPANSPGYKVQQGRARSRWRSSYKAQPNLSLVNTYMDFQYRVWQVPEGVPASS